MMHRIKLGLAVFLILATAAARGQSPDEFVVKRATELRGAPGDASPSLGSLPEQSPVTRLAQRQGAWIEVKTAKGTVGWLHLFDVTTVTSKAGSASAAGALRGISNFFSRGAGQQASAGMTSTVGIRGLGAEDLQRSEPNLAAVSQAEGLRSSSDQARAFGREARLVVHTVEPLPIPPEPAPTNPPPGR